jgi:ribosomal protein L14E/L6E/L27E
MGVTDSDASPIIGQVVRIIRGRDTGKFAIVVARLDDNKSVFVADGDKRKFDSPKRKNLIHLEPLDYTADEVADSIRESGRVTNGKLRYHLNKFMEQYSEGQMKGE